MEPRFSAETEPFSSEPEAGVIPRPRHEVQEQAKAPEPEPAEPASEA